MTTRVSLEEVGRLGPEILAGRIRGRTVVEIG
jgi:acrylyl-CoA reductase (NADPH)